MLLLGEHDFAATGHDSLDADSLVMVTLRQATSSDSPKLPSTPITCRPCRWSGDRKSRSRNRPTYQNAGLGGLIDSQAKVAYPSRAVDGLVIHEWRRLAAINLGQTPTRPQRGHR